MDCQYPQNASSTAYKKGCRCDRCCTARRAIDRAWRAANLEEERARVRAWRAANPEKERARVRAWRAANRVGQNERTREYRASNSESVSIKRKALLGRYQACSAASATVSGRWTAAEDLVVTQWEGTTLHLAFALGRTYKSTDLRISRLRKRGVKLKRDVKL